MKKWEISLLCGLVLAVIASGFSSFAADCATVRSDTLRLHILAASDAEADQQNKLRVRDALLAQFGALFAEAGTKQEAVTMTQTQLAAMQQTAEQTLLEAGAPAPVEVRMANLFFATKAYDGFTLPAGRYDAVRVEIGPAQGRNWFCVLYPALCVPAATADAQQAQSVAATYTPRERAVLKERYTVKFALVEWLEREKQEKQEKQGA